MEVSEDHKPVDFYFAKRIAPNASEPVALFLANLLKAARAGHLCVPSETGITLPEHL